MFCFVFSICLDEVEATPGIVYYHGAVCHDTIRLVFSCERGAGLSLCMSVWGELSVNCAARGGCGGRGIAVLIIDTRRLAPKMFHFNVVRSGDRRSSLAPSIRRPAPPLSSPSRCCHLSLPPLVDMCVCIYCLMTQRMHSMVVRTLRPITELYRRYLVISAIPLTFGEHLGS